MKAKSSTCTPELVLVVRFLLGLYVLSIETTKSQLLYYSMVDFFYVNTIQNCSIYSNDGDVC